MDQVLQTAISIILASIPAIVWGVIFYRKDPVYEPRAMLTFMVGMLSVIPMLVYKWSWDYIPQLNVFQFTDNFQTDVLQFSPYYFLPLGTIFAFMFVGVLEEHLKHLVVAKTDKGFFRNIDDAIEFSIIAALGFSFIENVLYFYYIWEFQGTETLFISFVFRAIFSTFAHILFSGIYGYFYGIAYFADPIWSEEIRRNRHPVVDWFHKVFHLKKTRVFATEMVSQGRFLAVTLHAGFNILLELNVTWFMVPFLIFGYAYLNYLFKLKENHKEYGRLRGDYTPGHLHHWIWLFLNRKKQLLPKSQ